MRPWFSGGARRDSWNSSETKYLRPSCWTGSAASILRRDLVYLI